MFSLSMYRYNSEVQLRLIPFGLCSQHLAYLTARQHSGLHVLHSIQRTDLQSHL